MTATLALVLALLALDPEPEPEAEPEPTPLYVHCLSCPAVDVDGLDAEFLTGAVPIAACESTHREGAVNPSGATGYMQVMLPLHLPKVHALGYEAADMLRAGPNLRVAFVIWRGRGWPAWSCWGLQ